jgi:hypothetical protein
VPAKLAQAWLLASASATPKFAMTAPCNGVLLFRKFPTVADSTTATVPLIRGNIGLAPALVAAEHLQQILISVGSAQLQRHCIAIAIVFLDIGHAKSTQIFCECTR